MNQQGIEVSCPNCGHVQPSMLDYEAMEESPALMLMNKMQGETMKAYAFHGATTCLKCGRKYIIILSVSSMED